MKQLTNDELIEKRDLSSIHGLLHMGSRLAMSAPPSSARRVMFMLASVLTPEAGLDSAPNIAPLPQWLPMGNNAS